MGLFAVILLLMNAVLVLAILFVLMSMRGQSRRITRIAEEARDLAERAEKHVAEAMDKAVTTTGDGDGGLVTEAGP